jgi:hypothetical protein
MAARLIDGVKYIYLHYPHEFKMKSLEDDIYFTLTDMVWNGGGIHEPAPSADKYSRLLTDIEYEKRDKNFKYKNVLYNCDSDFAEKILKLISRFSNKERVFYFYEEDKYDDLDDGKGLDMSKYMKYDDWWEHLLELREKIKGHLNKKIETLSNE